MKNIYIRHEPIELYKILKFENLVYGGGEAKLAISGGYVLLNGEVETQKRKKIVSGDVIEFDQQLYQILLESQSHTNNGDNTNQNHVSNNNNNINNVAQASKPSSPEPKAKPKRSAIKF